MSAVSLPARPVDSAAFTQPPHDVIHARTCIRLEDVSNLSLIEVRCSGNFLNRLLGSVFKLRPIDPVNIAHHFQGRQCRYLRDRLEGLCNDLTRSEEHTSELQSL